MDEWPELKFWFIIWAKPVWELTGILNQSDITSLTLSQLSAIIHLGIPECRGLIGL